MSNSDYSDGRRAGMETDEEPPPLHEPNIATPGVDSAAQWGLGALLIGCTLLIASCTTLVFNVLLFRAGPAGIPTRLAFAGGLIGVLALTALGLASVFFGLRGCTQAFAYRSSPALGIAGTAASIVGLIAWIIAGIDLMMILGSFVR